MINFRVSADERERLRQAAIANRQSLSDFARDAIVTAASETLEDDGPDHAETGP